MKRLILLLSLFAGACAPNALNLPGGTRAPVPAGVSRVIGRYDTAVDAGSIWVDRAGAIYITDRARWRVLSYQRDGDSCVVRYELDLPTPGSFLVPGYDEGFCLADNIGQRIIYYSSQGRQTGEMAVAGRTVSAAAISSAGDVFILDGPQRTIAVYDSRGGLLRQFALARDAATDLSVPSAMAVSRSGSLIAIAGQRGGAVALYTGFGHRFLQSRTAAVALAFDSYDRLWSLDGLGRVDVREGHQYAAGPIWPDSARSFGPAGVIAIGNGNAAVIAAAGSFHSCR